MNNKRLLKTLLIMLTTLISTNTQAYDLYTFDIGSKYLVVSGLISGEKKDEVKVDWTYFMNPIMTVGHQGHSVALSYYASSEQWLIDRKTKQATFFDKIRTQYQYDDENAFYVKALDKGFSSLVHATTDGHTEIFKFKGNDNQQPIVAANGIISWYFIRSSEGILFTFDMNTKKSHQQSFSCKKVIRLEENYFCVSKKNQAQIVDNQQNVIKKLQKLDGNAQIISFKAEYNEMILAQSSLSFALADFLTEYKDIYSLNLKTGKLKLLKSKAAALGMAYYVN